MWECGKCGTTNIAGDLDVCPHCRAPREQPEQAPAEEEGKKASAKDNDGKRQQLRRQQGHSGDQQDGPS